MEPTFIQILILGLVQGAAELLPVSSSAHVIVAEKLMGLDPSSPEMTFLLAMLHTGTLFAVIVYFWKSWKKSFFESSAAFKDAAVKLVAGTAVTGLVGFGLIHIAKKLFLHGRTDADAEELFSILPLIAVSLACAGALIVWAGLRRGLKSNAVPAAPMLEAVDTLRAGYIGFSQGLCLPFRGLSRSGTTISTGMLLGVPRRAAEEFSFALAVVITPPVIAKELYRLFKARTAAGAPLHLVSFFTPGLIGMVCSFAAGLLALKWLSGWLENGKWHYFGFYCFAAAAGVAVLVGMGY
jgi:undecaprenyl-diphosphatase